MAVSLYFGLPGCGKTTLLSKLALDGLNDPRYQHVYVNIHLNLPGVTYIDNECIGKYEIADGLLLIDEATLFADSRAHKEFSKSQISYFLEHRHRNVDICLFTQQWDGVDRKIRVITDRVYHVKKGLLFGKWLTTYYRIPYDIIIPDPKRDAGSKLGEIIQGYCKPPWLVRLFAKRIFRPRYYKYFDSWALDPFPALPEKYAPIEEDVFSRPIAVRWLKTVRRFDKQHRRRKKRVKNGKTKVLFSRKLFNSDPVPGL